jgi:predicted DNA-binding ribbon-helix-helix protein
MTVAMRPQSRDQRSVLCDGVHTCITVDDITWHLLRCMAINRGLSLSMLVGEINRTMRLLPERRGKRRVRSLSSAVRVFVLQNAPFKDGIG